jgi:hypothetical protein
VPLEHKGIASKDRLMSWSSSCLKRWKCCSSSSPLFLLAFAQLLTSHHLLVPPLSISPIFLKESTKMDRYRCGFGGMRLNFHVNLVVGDLREARYKRRFQGTQCYITRCSQPSILFSSAALSISFNPTIHPQVLCLLLLFVLSHVYTTH